MIAVAVKELKNRLSEYLREVKLGEVVLVTDRGRVVAELRRPGLEGATYPSLPGLERLQEEGRLTMGLPQDPSVYGTSEIRSKVSIDALLDQEREER